MLLILINWVTGVSEPARRPFALDSPDDAAPRSENAMSEQLKYLLEEARMPRAWYNIQADLPNPLPPPLHPGTHQPLGPDDLAPL